MKKLIILIVLLVTHKMTSTQVVETSVTTSNSSSQYYTNLEDQPITNFSVNPLPGFRAFIISTNNSIYYYTHIVKSSNEVVRMPKCSEYQIKCFLVNMETLLIFKQAFNAV